MGTSFSLFLGGDWGGRGLHAIVVVRSTRSSSTGAIWQDRVEQIASGGERKVRFLSLTPRQQKNMHNAHTKVRNSPG